MDTQNQNQNQAQPNYDFIMNQETPVADKKPNRRKILIIVGIIGVFFLLVVAAIVASVQQQVTQSLNPQQTTVNAYLTNVKNGDYKTAYKYLDPANEISEENFVNFLGPMLSDSVDLGSCTIADGADLPSNIVEATCTQKGNNANFIYKFDVGDQNPYLIKKVDVDTSQLLKEVES